MTLVYKNLQLILCVDVKEPGFRSIKKDRSDFTFELKINNCDFVVIKLDAQTLCKIAKPPLAL